MSVTQSQQNAAVRIYNQALAGTPNHPGVPPALAALIVGQSGNETGGWTSDFFEQGNACFGYSCDLSDSDYQTSCSTSVSDNGVTVGYYDSIEDSTMEIIDWIYRRVADGSFPSDLSTITTANQYATLLKNAGPDGSKSYYGASEASYESNINLWLSRVGSFFHKRLPRRLHRQS